MEGTQRKTPAVYKVIILGESNVGKSSLFLRYTADEFREAIANTIGINNSFKELVLEGQPVHLQLWDTAGQERFRSIVSAFYREADGFILVYDVTSSRSFDYITQLIEELSEVIDPSFTVLVGNKVDWLDDMKEEYSKLRKFADKHGFRHYLTSARTGENVNEMFEELANSLFHKKKKDNTTKNTLDISQRKGKRRFWCYK